MKYKSIIGTGTGNGIFLGKPLEENQKTASGVGGPHGFHETVPHCIAYKGKLYISGYFLKEYLILGFFFKAKNGDFYNGELI